MNSEAQSEDECERRENDELDPMGRGKGLGESAHGCVVAHSRGKQQAEGHVVIDSQQIGAQARVSSPGVRLQKIPEAFGPLRLRHDRTLRHW